MHKWLLLTLFLYTSPCENKAWISLILFWNVGQGQWVTAITPDQCLHFDFGGELSYWPKNKNLFLKLCKNKLNILNLSHADLDHFSLYSVFTKALPNICWSELDHTSIPTNRISRKLPLCLNAENPSQKRIYKPKKFTNKNESSFVYSYKNTLMPGDSPQRQEKIWTQLMDTSKINFLVLGHHGSKTSTGPQLLSNLPHLKMAIVQSRQKRFNHPHPDTLKRLKKYRIPLLRVEDWGNTAIQLD